MAVSKTAVSKQDEQLIIKYSKLYAYKSFGKVQEEDLAQEARLALFLSADRIPEDPVHARRYKLQRIEGSMIDWTRSQSWAPRSEMKNENKTMMVALEALTGVDKNGDVTQFELEETDLYQIDKSLRLRDAGKVISKFPERSQKILMMILEGYTNEDIAAIMGVSSSLISIIAKEVTEKITMACTEPVLTEKVKFVPLQIFKFPKPIIKDESFCLF